MSRSEVEAMHDFPERVQWRYVQRNDTWGHIVPIDVLAREVGTKRVEPRQIQLL